MKSFKSLFLSIVLLCLPTVAHAEPPAPAGLRSNLENGTLVLNWNPTVFAGFKGYNLYVKRPGSDHFVLITPQPITDTWVNLKKMKTGQEYEFSLTSVDTAGGESPQTRLKVVLHNPALSPPQGFKAEISDNGIQLIWDKGDPASMSGFNLYLADESGNPTRKLTGEPLADNQVTLKKLKRDKTYRFLLTALSTDGRESLPTPALVVPYSGGPAGVSTNPVETTESKPNGEIPLGSWFLALAGGMDLPVENWQPGYTLGPGGKITLGYEFNKNLAVQLDVVGFYFSGNNYSGTITDIELIALPSLRYRFFAQGFSPYLLAGVGADIETLSAAPGQVILENVDAAGGIGMEIPLSGRANVFAEAKLNFLFFPGVTAQDVPVLAGVRFGL